MNHHAAFKEREEITPCIITAAAVNQLGCCCYSFGERNLLLQVVCFPLTVFVPAKSTERGKDEVRAKPHP